jgi:hypothetical protein
MNYTILHAFTLFILLFKINLYIHDIGINTIELFLYNNKTFFHFNLKLLQSLYELLLSHSF